MAYTLSYSLALGPAYAATADLRAQLVDTAGSNVGSAISTGFVNIGNGHHMWTYASMPDDHRGGVKFYSNAASSTVLAFLCVNPQEAEYSDTKTSTRGTSTLTTGDIDSRLYAYDPPTKAELDSAVSSLATQTSVDALAGYVDTEVATILAAVDSEIAAIKAKTDNLPATPASTSDIPGTAAIATAIFAVAVETGHDLTTVLRAIYAAIRGRSVANSATNPTTITYYAPDNSTARIVHTLTDTERTAA